MDWQCAPIRSGFAKFSLFPSDLYPGNHHVLRGCRNHHWRIAMASPDVSIVITAYNVESYIGATIDAALAQTYPHCEVVVVDDGSQDNTRAVLAGYGDRIRLFTQPNSGGPARPRNAGIANARGKFVAFCDGDDCMEPDSVAGAVVALEGNPRASLVWGDFVCNDPSGRRHGQRWSDEYTTFRQYLESIPSADCWILPASVAFSQLLNGLFLGTSSVVVRRQVLEQAGPFDETLPNGDDREMWLRLARIGDPFLYRDRVAYQYRLHSNSVSRRGFRRIPAMINVLERQLVHIADAQLRASVEQRIHGLRFSYAAGLHRAGETTEARRVYAELLRERVTLMGLRGLARAVLGL